MQKEEIKIIEAAKKNPKAFAEIYNMYFKEVFRFVYYRIHDKEITADLTSQVFYKALTNIKRFKYKNIPISAWLIKIAANEVGQFYRKSSRIRQVSINEEMIEGIAEEIEATDREHLMNRVIQLIQELTQDAVKLIELRFFERKSFKEIGYILNITENNAKVRTYRVLDKLKQQLKHEKL